MPRTFIIASLGFTVALAACNQEPAKTEPAKTQQAPTPAAKKEHPFRGKILKVDQQAKTITVDGESVDGWMSAMTMTYSADKPDVYDTVKAGDQITAKVKDG